MQGNRSRGLQWYPSTIWPLWHSGWCLQGWLWIPSFSDQRPAFWMQAWSVCYINSLRSCPNSSSSCRIRASEELHIVAPHGEMTPPSLLTSGVLTHPVLFVSWPERVCFEKNGPLFFLVLNKRRRSQWSSLAFTTAALWRHKLCVLMFSWKEASVAYSDDF